MDVANKDTISAFASAPSSGALALLRASGPLALSALCALTKKDNFAPREACFVKVYDGKEILDTAVAVYYAAPKSYTGEDCFELSLHASPYIKARALELLCSLGLRPAEGGEFTMRAFLNGKLDLTQAQGVCDIIAASNKSQHKAALNILEGRLSKVFKEIKTNLSELLAQIEVRLDDADDEMPALEKPKAQNLLSGTLSHIDALCATYSSGRLIKEGVKTAIIGLPNSGKSSLLNALCGYARAIVSEESGTTRDTVETYIKVKDYSLLLIDTAGINNAASCGAEKEGVARSRQALEQADVVLFVRDFSQNAAAQDKLFEEVSLRAARVVKVLNKSDLMGKQPAAAAAALCAAEGAVLVSAKTGEGVDNLKEAVIKLLGLSSLGGQDIIITCAQHYKALCAAAQELRQAQGNLREGELCAEHLRRALNLLRELLGEVSADDILDIIFSKFCVGK